jgi:hypothetical protein
MIWLTWRQFRVPAVVVCAALAVVAVLLAVTGPHVAGLYRTYGVEHFFDQLMVERFNRGLFLAGTGLVYALPAVIGAFWGAPLVARELEAGTHKLVWNQSVTRNRWLAGKLSVLGPAAALAGLVGTAMTWWSAPIDKAINGGAESDGGPFAIPRLSATLFGGQGIVPLGYAVLAFTVGVLVGLVLRRTVAAMAVTLVLVAVVQVVVPLVVTPRLLAPVVTKVIISQSTLESAGVHQRGGPLTHVTTRLDAPGAWILANETVDPSGKVVTALPAWSGECLTPPGETSAKTDACYARLADAGYRQRIEYLPASRYWPLQWIVTALLLGASLLTVGFSFWWLRRRLS